MSRSPVEAKGSGVILHVWVVPGSSRTQIDGLHGDRLKIRVSAPPEDGKANSEVASTLEKAIGSPITLISGMRGRAKVFQVTTGDVDTVSRKLGLS
ncbi:MAG: DUF167 domain-containing protein [Acidimicrobiia bacterium]|jgi:uncharacterized protein (TIGR00251 family)